MIIKKNTRSESNRLTSLIGRANEASSRVRKYIAKEAYDGHNKINKGINFIIILWYRNAQVFKFRVQLFIDITPNLIVNQSGLVDFKTNDQRCKHS